MADSPTFAWGEASCHKRDQAADLPWSLELTALFPAKSQLGWLKHPGPLPASINTQLFSEQAQNEKPEMCSDTGPPYRYRDWKTASLQKKHLKFDKFDLLKNITENH